MKSIIIVPTVLAGMLVFAQSRPAQADQCDQLTFLTFNTPVALPGVTLPAGTYRFTQPECTTSNGLLRVSSQDGKEVYGTFQTIPRERSTRTSRPEVLLAQMPKGMPEAIAAWFYPGETTGEELIYPKDEATKLAKAPVQEIFATNGPA